MIRAAEIASRLAPTVEMHSSVGASLLAMEPVSATRIADQRPLLHSQAPTRIPIPQSTAT